MEPLPLELIEAIISFLHSDHTALTKCSLICRAWVLSTRRHLFNQVVLSSRSNLHLYDFYTLLTSPNPTFLSSVRHLVLRRLEKRLSFPPQRSLNEELTVMGTRPILTPLQIKQGAFFFSSSDENWIGLFEQLSKLSNLESLSLGLTDWHLVDATVRKTFLATFASIRVLYIDGAKFGNMVELASFLSYHHFPNLEVLNLWIQDVDSASTINPVPSEDEQDFRTLELSKTLSNLCISGKATRPAIIQWILNHKRSLPIRSLELPLITIGDMSHANSLLRFLEASLEEFSFSLDTSFYMGISNLEKFSFSYGFVGNQTSLDLSHNPNLKSLSVGNIKHVLNCKIVDNLHARTRLRLLTMTLSYSGSRTPPIDVDRELLTTVLSQPQYSELEAVRCDIHWRGTMARPAPVVFDPSAVQNIFPPQLTRKLTFGSSIGFWGMRGYRYTSQG